ncbi:MAG: hypothetical protein M3Q69_21420 [Acidobacteriota bacterium]|nr:hypothetical protein [Acidobacteriota bacterium]
MKKLFALLAVFLLTGCFEIEQSIDLKTDLSGQAGFHLGVDLEPLVVVMAQFGRAMEGKEGPLTAEELAKAKAEFKRSSKSSKNEMTRKDIQDALPEGVTLVDYGVKEQDFAIASDFRFAFAKLSHLVGVKLPSKNSDPAHKNVIDSPFEGIELSESGNTITLRTKPQNPVESVKEQASEAPKLDAATEKLVREAFRKMSVTYRITAPFEVVSTNATRREGNTLVWEYNIDTFDEMAKSKRVDDAQLRVTYRR